MRSKLSQKSKGIISIIGACLMYLPVGSTYILGNINIYVSSYFPGVTSDQTNIVFPITVVVGNIVVVLSIPISKFIGYRKMLILSTLLTWGFIFASTFCKSFWLFFFFFGIGYGGTTGFLYMNLMFNSYKYFPKKRGLIGGILMGVYGISSLISNYILLYMMNPDNMMALKKNNDEYYFPDEIANRLPEALRVLSYYFLGVMILGNFFQYEYKEEKFDKAYPQIKENNENNDNSQHLLPKSKEKYNNSINEGSNNEKLGENLNEDKDIVKPELVDQEIPKVNINPEDETQCKTLLQAFKSKALYLIMIMTYFSIQNGYFIASNFKNYGISKISDDNFLTLVGSLSSVCNGCGRFIWGVISDKLQFKTVYLIILTIQIIDMLTLRFISEYKVAYLIWICIALLCEGGHFVIFPPLSLKVFGPVIALKAFSAVLLGIAAANVTQFGLNLGLRQMIGFENEFFIFLAFSVISMLVCLTNKIQFKN